MVKIVYKYINEFLDEEKLIEELEKLLINEENGKHKKDLEKLIKEIKKAIKKHENNKYLRCDEILNLLINNNLYLELVEKMDTNDLMLLITDYIFVPNVPSLSQETFNEVVEAAINSGEDSRENCWRLAMNYQYSDLNLEKIEDYLISIRDAWYVAELMSTLQDVLDLDKIVQKIIMTNDLDFINNILKQEFLNVVLNEKQFEKLRKVLN